jgi:nucleotidyltransferase-like protein
MSVGDCRNAVAEHPAVRSVELVGSRARGEPTALSDWDFLVEAEATEVVISALPALIAAVNPLAAQWDRLSEEATYFMVLLRDGTKVDFVIRRPPRLEPPWNVSADTLAGVDAHFWDWILWLGGKQLRGADDLVQLTLSRLMYDHLLEPMGATTPPETIAAAVALYRSLRDNRERELGVTLGRELDTVVSARLASAGVI